MERNICKHFMYGYCKLKDHCPKQHIDVICPTFRECDDNGCVLRHPKRCKYFAQNKICKFERCAYSHDKDGKTLEIEGIVNEVSALKKDVVKLKKINKEKINNVRVEARSNSKQLAKLNNTVNDVVERVKILEQEQTKDTEEAIAQKTSDEAESKTDKDQNESNDSGINKSGEADDIINMKGDTMESAEAKNDINVNMMQSNKQTLKIRSTDNDKLNFECQHCDFNCPSKVTLNKHMNTKHALKASYKECEAKECSSKCSLCEDKFKSLAEFRSHIQEHLDKIEEMDIPSLTNEHDLFECNLCSFESGNEESVREHLIDHVNQSIRGVKHKSIP